MRARRTAGWIAAGSALTAGSLLAISWLISPREFYHDFRGQPLPDTVQLSGPQVGRFVVVEADGLRIRLPKDRRDRAQVGLSVQMQVHGDFVMTAAIRLVAADAPRGGYGVGALIGVDDRARVGRMVRPGSRQTVLWDYWPVVDGVRTMEAGAVPCSADECRLRLERSGTTLRFLWSPSMAGDSFDEIHAVEFGLEDTRFVTVVADTSGQPCAIDVRLLELAIRPLSQPVAILRWLAIAVGLAGVAGAVGVVAVPDILQRWRARAPRLPAMPVPTERQAPAPPTDVQVPCPHCARRLRLSANAVGKKVKCPACGIAFVRPGS